MPHPRFEKLPEDKRKGILEAAAKEFGSRGYDDTSLNQVLAAAGLSKGSAYYYFNDKADLFETVVRHFMQSVVARIASRGRALLESKDAEAFWQTVRDMYVQSITVIDETPWMGGLLRESMKLQAPGATETPLSRLTAEMRDWLAHGPLRIGQRCGAIRSDLPDDLLIDLALAIDQTLDRWLIDRIDRLSRAELVSALGRYPQLLRRVLAPQAGNECGRKAVKQRRRRL